MSIDDLLARLDAIAVAADHYELGLPFKDGVYSEYYQQMVDAVEAYRNKVMAAMGIVSGSATLEERAEWLVDSSFRHIVSNKDDQLFIAEKIAEEIRNAVIASKVEGK